VAAGASIAPEDVTFLNVLITLNLEE